MRKRIRRRVSVGKDLCFEYEISPHRAFLTNSNQRFDSVIQQQSVLYRDPTIQDRKVSPAYAALPVGAHDDAGKVGVYVPFNQRRLDGQINPLRPPLHTETVLIGRALGQPTGYRLGVGYRIRDDGYVEAEFQCGVRKYKSYAEFKIEVDRLYKAGAVK